MASLRPARLNKLFNATCAGTRELSPEQRAQFLESICACEDSQSSLIRFSTLTSSWKGLDALQVAMFTDLSPTFLNNQGADIFKFLQTPDFAKLGGGSVLSEVVLKLFKPSSLVDAYANALAEDRLDLKGQQAFVWFLSQLASLPALSSNASFYDVALQVLAVFQRSLYEDVRASAQAIERTLTVSNPSAGPAHGPGGRHDNDFEDFEDIAILPTIDEINCQIPPFLLSLLQIDDMSADCRPRAHVESQFRLLREDMLCDIREELQRVQSPITNLSGHRNFRIEVVRPIGLYFGSEKRSSTWGLQLQCADFLQDLFGVKTDDHEIRARSLDTRKDVLGDQSLVCLIVNGDISCLATVRRDLTLLSLPQPIIVIQFDSQATTANALISLKYARKIELVQIDSPVFAYKPILKSLQSMPPPILSSELFLWDNGPLECPTCAPRNIIGLLEDGPNIDLGPPLGLDNAIILDHAQRASLLAALQQRLSLIQGPPGTGKSFVGALLARILFDESNETILVCCYTNHALDQFFEDLRGVGIPDSAMVRIGGKSSSNTQSLSLYNQTPLTSLQASDYEELDLYRCSLETESSRMESLYQDHNSDASSDTELLDYLEVAYPDFAHAFRIPYLFRDDGMTTVAGNSKNVDDLYLFRRWRGGQNRGVFERDRDKLDLPKRVSAIWNMDATARSTQVQTWYTSILRDPIEKLYEAGEQYNFFQGLVDRKFEERNIAILRTKPIIGCTTTGAAEYSQIIHAAAPSIVIVEEAGEILESHVLAALGRDASMLCLIGDHLQLRPKVNNYDLTVEKGDGYELNVSLFERLVKAGYPHQTLRRQHRMRPEISELIRHLTYPDLIDADGTKNRPNLRGVRDNVLFVTHNHPEDEMKTRDTHDGGSRSSKQNTFEANMVLKIVKYLMQQGYNSSEVVVLTPYLGQLYNLKNSLRFDVDPCLSEMDSRDLARVGLSGTGPARESKRPLRISTVDNYQGEESPIVIISLTRSNSENDIGFLFSPERLNVLLSRARDACIIIGNAKTFRKSRKGGELWARFLDYIEGRGHLYDGFPVVCVRHPDRKATLKTPREFEQLCPDGGCSEPCGIILNCGLHQCTLHCHNLSDHSKLRCGKPLSHTCPKGHKFIYPCSDGPPAACKHCEKVPPRLGSSSVSWRF